jgi:AcrR family transcriptional regulator
VSKRSKFPAAPAGAALGKKARSRAKLIAAAAAAIAERGFQNTSLEDIAARAGMTKGAIYSNFESKEELFLAVVREQNVRLDPKIVPNMSARDLMRALEEACMATLPEARARSAFSAEFLLYTLTHEEMRKRLARAYENAFDTQAAFLERSIPARDLRVPREMLPEIIQCFVLGVLYQSLLTPNRITREVISAFFGALA